MSVELHEIDIENGNAANHHRKSSQTNPAFELNEKEELPKQNGVKDAGHDVSDYEVVDEVTVNPVIRCIVTPLHLMGKFMTKYRKLIRIIALVILALGYFAYMVAALVRNFQRAIPLLVIFCLVVFFQSYAFIRDRWGGEIWKAFRPAYKAVQRNIYWIKWVFIVILIALLATWIALDTSKRPNQLISMAGYIVIVLLLFLGSKYPGQVSGRFEPNLAWFGR